MMSSTTWADGSETRDSLFYKLLSYFGRRDTGAHGPVCVPSVPETLSHFGGGGQSEGAGGVHGSSDVIALIKLGVEVVGGLDV